MMSTDPHPLTTLPGVLVPVHTLRSHPCASVPVNKYPQKDEQAYLTRGFDLDLPLGREKAEEKSREPDSAFEKIFSMGTSYVFALPWRCSGIPKGEERT